MKENKGRSPWSRVHHRRRHLSRKASSKKTPTRCQAYYRERGYVKAQVGQPELKILEDSQGRQDALRAAADSRHRRAALQDRRGHVLGQHRRQDRRAAAALQGRAGRVVQREDDPEGLREGARGVRQRRLFRVHRRSGLRVPERSEDRRCADGTTGKRRPARPPPRAAGAGPAGRQRRKHRARSST